LYQESRQRNSLVEKKSQVVGVVVEVVVVGVVVEVVEVVEVEVAVAVAVAALMAVVVSMAVMVAFIFMAVVVSMAVMVAFMAVMASTAAVLCFRFVLPKRILESRKLEASSMQSTTPTTMTTRKKGYQELLVRIQRHQD
jgi:hypothetical protein